VSRSWGIVLGAGGVLGGAWQVGVMAALEDHVGADLRDADVLVGTSVGSLNAALLGAGVPVADLVAHQEGQEISEGLLAGVPWDYDTAVESAYRLQPFARPGSTRLVREALRGRARIPAGLLVASLVPVGRGSLDNVAGLLDRVVDGPWPGHRDLRVVAVDYDSGQRTVFGRAPGARTVDIGPAVLASCSVPGMFPPLEIHGHRYVDGGVWSTTNADVLGREGLDDVYVVAPLAALSPVRTRTVRDAVAWRWRKAMTRRTLREVATLRASGTRVTLLGPGSADMELMGLDLMDVTRRLEVLVTGRRTAARALTARGRSEAAEL
jgi:NTE family protein